VKYFVLNEYSQKKVADMLDELGLKIEKNPARPGSSSRAKKLIDELKSHLSDMSCLDEFASLTVMAESTVLKQTLSVEEGEYTLIALQKNPSSKMVH
jgi:hypothetical protein